MRHYPNQCDGPVFNASATTGRGGDEGKSGSETFRLGKKLLNDNFWAQFNMTDEQDFLSYESSSLLCCGCGCGRHCHCCCGCCCCCCCCCGGGVGPPRPSDREHQRDHHAQPRSLPPHHHQVALMFFSERARHSLSVARQHRLLSNCLL